MKLKGCTICPKSKYTKDREDSQKLFLAAKKVIDDAAVNGRTPTTQEIATFNNAKIDFDNKKILEEKHLAAVASKKCV